MKLNHTYHEYNLQTMAGMPDGFVNLVCTSPPYALARKKLYNSIHPDTYCEWFKPIAKEIYRVLADDGSFILNIGDNTINGETHLYTFELPIMLCRELGFKLIDPFIWHKKTTPPGRFPNRFKGAWEFCYHFAKQTKIKFFPRAVTKPVLQSSLARYANHKDSHVKLHPTGFTNPAGNARRARSTDSGFGTNDAQLYMVEDALPSNVLYFSPETQNTSHPAPFPVDLPSFFIKAFTAPGDVVYDPFAGSGTTGEAAARLDRNFILSEAKALYIPVINTRLAPHTQPKLFTL